MCSRDEREAGSKGQLLDTNNVPNIVKESKRTRLDSNATLSCQVNQLFPVPRWVFEKVRSKGRHDQSSGTLASVRDAVSRYRDGHRHDFRFRFMVSFWIVP